MKKKIYTKWIAIVIVVMQMCAYLQCEVYSQNNLLSIGEEINNFEVIKISEDANITTFRHKKTNALVVYNANEDNNRSFDISFRTPAENNKGIPHILEHAVLSGSEKYPSSTLFFKVKNQTYNTYMNAITYQNYTTYPIASMSEKQLYKLADFYLDSVFHPLIYSDPSIFERESWHYELDKEDDDLTASGNVYTEMMGKQDISNSILLNTRKVFFPDSYSANVSAGNPDDILDSTYSEVIEYHKKYYHPSNSLTVIYGDVDYIAFLTLLDGYFSEYEMNDVKINFNEFSGTPNKYNEETFDYPVYDGDEMKSYITYSFECKDAQLEDIVNMHQFEAMMNSSSSEIKKRISEQLPGATVSCSVDMNGPEPIITFAVTNIHEDSKYKFKQIIDTAINDVVNHGIRDELKQDFDAEYRRIAAKGFSNGNTGVSFSVSLAEIWAVYYDFHALIYNNTEVLEGKDDDVSIEDTIKKYLNSSSRTALVATVPNADLKEKQQTNLKEKMLKIKGAMSKEDIGDVINYTKLYKNQTENDKDNVYINELNVFQSEGFNDEVKDYNIQDTKQNDVRYITSTADIPDIGKGRIMIDVSNISGDDLHWLALYNLLIGQIDTEKYSWSQLESLQKRYADYGTDFVTLKTQDGMKPYLIFKYEGFSDESEEIFDIANQVLFKADFKNIDAINNIIEQSIYSLRINMERDPYGFMLTHAAATSNDEYAYINATSGIEFYEFLNTAVNIIKSEPDKAVKKLLEIQNTIYNRNGAMVVYAGSEESIKRNTETSQKFFEHMPYKEIQSADFSYLRTTYQSEAFVINSNVNYNGIYAALDDLGIEYNGSLDVAWQYVYTKYLIPELRNKYNVYDILGQFDEYGFSICTYMDPGFENTLYTYIMLPEMIREDEITQEEVDNYILSVYSNFTKSGGELHSAYWAAADYSNGIKPEERAEKMRQIRATTADDINHYADIVDKVCENSILFTSGNAAVVTTYKDMFDNILNPFHYDMKDEITIIVNGEALKTAVPAQIVNDITLVPMRNIFEKLGVDVKWDPNNMTAEAQKDDKTIRFKINSNIVVVSDTNGEQHEIETEAKTVIVDDYTMIQLRVVSETLGCKIRWDSDTRTVYIDETR